VSYLVYKKIPFLFKLNLDYKDNTKSTETVVKELKMFIEEYGIGYGGLVMGDE
jgi:hypothetical protein